MYKKILITLCLALAVTAANAQTFLDELRHDQKGQGKVSVTQSEEIDRLVNGTKTEANTTTVTGAATTTTPAASSNNGTSTTTTAGPNTTTSSSNAEAPSSSSHSSTYSSVPSATETAPPAVNTNKKVMRRSYKTTGYRIQVYSGGNTRADRTKCEQIASRLKAVFPSLPIYVHFYSPSWKCRAGNFTNQAEAQSVLNQIRRMGYSQACLVKGTINVQY